MLFGYLWQMPVHQARSPQPIHGCCGMRLQQWFWPALLILQQALSPLTTSPKIRLGPQSWLATVDTEWATFGVLLPVRVFFSSSPPLSALSLLSCSLFLSLSLLLLSLGLIYLAGRSPAGGKAPGYICRLQRLDLLHGRWPGILRLVSRLTSGLPVSSTSAPTQELITFWLKILKANRTFQLLLFRR